MMGIGDFEVVRILVIRIMAIVRIGFSHTKFLTGSPQFCGQSPNHMNQSQYHQNNNKRATDTIRFESFPVTSERKNILSIYFFFPISKKWKLSL